MTNFEDYLKEVHAKNYSGTDDDMPDNFDLWLSQLDIEEWLELGDKFYNWCKGDIN